MSIDFEEAREKAYHELSKFETIRKCSNIPIQKMPLFVAAWEVDTEVEFDGSLHAITLILYFPKDFPFSIPKIYLSGKDYEKLKFIPHIDTDKFICTFRLDTIILDYKRPEVIVRDCLAQAKKNISDGKKGTNIDDYADEYLAYWKLRYPEEEPPTGSCLNMIENEIDQICFIKFGEFKQAIGKYTSCIYIDDDSYHNFSANLGYMGNTVVSDFLICANSIFYITLLDSIC